MPNPNSPTQAYPPACGLQMLSHFFCGCKRSGHLSLQLPLKTQGFQIQTGKECKNIIPRMLCKLGNLSGTKENQLSLPVFDEKESNNNVVCQLCI